MDKKRTMKILFSICMIFIIFLSTISLLISMNNVSEDIFGTQNNVMVFYEKDAPTPFNSRINIIYENAINNVEGVEYVSPEIFQSIVLNDRSAFLRGINYDKFNKLENLNIIQGSNEIDENPYTALIGENLADRLEIKINDLVVVESVLKGERVKLRVTGIYESTIITDDEILVNMDIARSVAGIPNYFFTHYRVKYDTSTTNEIEIYQNAVQKYDLNPKFLIKNSTMVEELEIVVRHISGYEILNMQLLEFNDKLELLAGEYLIQILDTTNLLLEINHILPKTNDLIINLGENEYLVNFTISYGNYLVDDVDFKIYDYQDNVLIEKKMENGNSQVKLPSGEYNFSLFDDLATQSFKFNVTSPVSISNEFDYEPYMITNLKNGTTLIKNDFKLFFDKYDPDFLLFLNDTVIEMSEFISDYDLTLNISNGNYKLQIMDKKMAEFSNYFFTVNSSLNYFDPEFENGDYVYYNDNETLKIKFNDLIPESINCNYNFENKDNSIEILLDDLGIGPKKIIIDGINSQGEDISWSIEYYVTNNTTHWYAGVPIPTVKENDELKIWFKSPLIFNETLIEKLDENAMNATIKIKSNNNGLQYLIEDEIGYFLVSNYSSLFKINNENITNIQLNNGINKIEYPDYNFPYQSNLFWEIILTIEGADVRLYDGQYFFLNNSNGISNITMRFINKITLNSEIVTIGINVNSTSFIKNKISGYPNIVKNGYISYENIENELKRGEYLKDNKIFYPIFGENNIILRPGDYSVKLNFSGQIYNWNFSVTNWHDEKELTDYFSNLDRYLYGNFTLDFGYYISSDNKDNYIVEDSALIFSYERDLNLNITKVQLDNLRDANMTISKDDEIWVNNISLNNETFSLPFFEGNYFITIINVDMNNIESIYNYNLIGEKEEKQYDISIRDYSRSNDSILNIEIFYFETNKTETYNFTNGQSYSIVSIEQKIKIDLLNGDDEEWEFELISNNSIDIEFGKIWVQIDVLSPNIDNIFNYISSIDLVTKNMSITIYDKNLFYEINFGEYDIFIHSEFGIFEYQMTLDENKTIVLNIPLLKSIINIEIINLIPPDIANLFLLNAFTGQTEILQFNYVKNFIINFELNYGIYEYTLNGTWGEITGTFENFSNNNFIISLDLENIKINNIDIDIILKAQSIGFAVSGEYLDNYLGGVLIILQIIIIVEILSLSLVAYFNVRELIRFTIIESKRELKIVKSIGGTNNQILLITYGKMIFGLILAIIGGIIASYIFMLYLIENNYTIFFGHQFHPNVLDFRLIIGSYLIINLITYLGFKNTIAYEVN